MVEAHYYVGAKPILHLGGDFGIQVCFFSVYVAGKLNAVIVNLGQRAEGKDLISTAVGQYRFVPGHKFVYSTECLHHINSGPQQQMVGIGQNKYGTGFFELLWCDTLYRSGGADWHKHRRFDLAVTCG